MTAADRPSVTDNARAESIEEAYQRGHEDGFWNGKTTDMSPRQAAEFMAPYRATCPGCAAGRAETTTATVATDAPALLAELERAQEREADAVQRAERAEALLATARTRPTRTIYSVQHWEDADGIRASWVTGYGQYTHSREDAEATLRHQERQHPDTTFRLAQAEVTAWTETGQ